MKSALVGGIGNVLLGDDGVGPYVLKQLESRYDFDGRVALADLGTPALDLTHQIVGLELLILIDSIKTNQAPGTIILYRKEDLLRLAPVQRLDPHSPALSECLMTADMLGRSPEYVLLIGIVGESFEPGRPLSTRVEQAVDGALHTVLKELRNLGYSFQTKSTPASPDIWWGVKSSIRRASRPDGNLPAVTATLACPR